MMPQLPYIMETKEHITKIVEAAVFYKAKFIVPAFGVTIRDQQRDYYYERLKELENFKELPQKYQKRFGEVYSASCVNHKKMKETFFALCKENNLSYDMPMYEKNISSLATQMSLFTNE
ncbi:MAG: hypothetical protein H7X94_02960 [Vallitaleaceae bacterium]|nr:hypothetical protein [Vallitaleaceae bacterium]